MVPTTSLEQGLDVAILDLYDPDFLEENQEVIDQATHLIEELVASIMPVIKYIDNPIKSTKRRGIQVCGRGSHRRYEHWTLFLSRDGNWFEFAEDSQNEDPIDSDDGWKSHSFSQVVRGLADALASAEEKKQDHLAAIEKRRKLIEAASDIISGE